MQKGDFWARSFLPSCRAEFLGVRECVASGKNLGE